MAALHSIRGITADEIRHLRAAGINSDGDLWNRLTADQKNAFQQLAADTGIASARVAALLQASLQQEERQLETRFLRRHWMDLVVLAGIALFIWAAFFWEADQANPRVLAKADLPAFHAIVATDLDLSGVPSGQQQAALRRYVGLYVTTNVEAGAKLTPKLVGASAVNLSGMALLRIYLKLPPVDTARRTPYPATLVVSPGKRPKAEMLAEADVIVLAYDQDPASEVVLALKPDQLAKISPLIGSSNAYLVQSTQ